MQLACSIPLIFNTIKRLVICTCRFPTLVFLLLHPRLFVPLPASTFMFPPLPLPVFAILNREYRRFSTVRIGNHLWRNLLRLRRVFAFSASSGLERSSVSLRQPGTQQLPERLGARLVRLNWRTSAEINEAESVRLAVSR